MWSKIKHRLTKLPVSIKLTIIYAVILFCILLLTSLLTMGGVKFFLATQAQKDLDSSRENVIRYLAAGNLINQQLLEQDLLATGVLLRIFDEQNRLLLDNAPYLKNFEHGPPRHREMFSDKKREFRNFHTGDDLYGQQLVWSGDRQYTLQFIRPLSAEFHFLRILAASLAGTSLLGLVIAIAAGLYISRRILRPVRDMTEAAKLIEIDNLEKRLKVSEAGDELSKLATTFNHMLNRIQAGFEQQRRFVSDASHELRTPITVISGYADMLDRWGKQDEAILTEGISAIKSEVINMHALLEKLLFLARADQGKQVVNKMPLAIEQLIDEVVRETRLIAPEHQVELAGNAPTIIQADGALIKQMLRIFLENSVKYTPVGGTIRITSEHQGTQLAITVQDDGIGIPVEEQTRIFDRFYCVDKSRTKATGGTGLGLSIASWIAEQHNSSIRVESNVGQGTAITVLLPLEQGK
ncbi:Adaptive-response sensory-kinase SasA [Sporomusa silvacetica DSM 10669]|uniref:histidine kinase n=1 Tax=Sporomusa silvacetica DSM 10669 TaxID=1123289 RepID=A0ABZ3INZ3_9FIRM|nr:ATP-binding protein [Sporomusa silvacetica]OZC18029.1 signal transduction histidine-protein kinase ArlS [Sporomusa silvacetica DSM 10669]